MARLNGKRRREMARVRALNELGKHRNAATQAETGHVRDSVQSKQKYADHVIPAVARALSPKPANLEGSGVRGRSVAGKLVRPKGPARWS